MGLQEYHRKRDFKQTPEPSGKSRKGTKKAAKAKGSSFVIQKHAATRLHYDFRLEMEGVLRSWAVPKGPSLDPGEKRLAVHVEDHPLEYGDFEGTIPKGEYGGGTVLLWDRGIWIPEIDPAAGYRKGHLKFRLEGEKLHGGWNLVRLHGRNAGENEENWLLIKENDGDAEPGSGDAVLRDHPASVASGRTLEEIAADPAPSPPSKAAKTTASAVDPRAIPGARKARFPRSIEPQLATPAKEPPHGDEWLHELKLDGCRALCAVREGKARMSTQTGEDWTGRFGSIAAAAAALPVREALLDGEVVVLEPDGRSSFQALQDALGAGRERDLLYFVFDLLYLDGHDLRPAALVDRKAALASLLAAGAPLRLSDHVQGQGEAFYRQACGYRLEGVVAKRADRPYRSGRGKDWLAIRCVREDEA